MKRPARFSLSLLGVAATLALPASASACAACYGQSDSPMAAGMNWGILSLLVMIVLVLVGVAGFFFFLIRRSITSSATTSAAVAASWAASWPVTTSEPRPFDDSPQPRGGLKSQSTFARQRKHCAQNRTTAAAMVASRGRS